jgi:hypothetical protein
VTWLGRRNPTKGCSARGWWWWWWWWWWWSNGRWHITMVHLLTPWSRVLLEKLTDLQLVKNFPACYGNRRFITAITIARQLSLSWASSIQPIPPHPTSWRSILILSSPLQWCTMLLKVYFSKYYFKSARWDTDTEEKVQIMVIKNPVVHRLLINMSSNPQESFKHILWQFCNLRKLFHFYVNEMKGEKIKL